MKEAGHAQGENASPRGGSQAGLSSRPSRSDDRGAIAIPGATTTAGGASRRRRDAGGARCRVAARRWWRRTAASASRRQIKSRPPRVRTAPGPRRGAFSTRFAAGSRDRRRSRDDEFAARFATRRDATTLEPASRRRRALAVLAGLIAGEVHRFNGLKTMARAPQRLFSCEFCDTCIETAAAIRGLLTMWRWSCVTRDYYSTSRQTHTAVARLLQKLAETSLRTLPLFFSVEKRPKNWSGRKLSAAPPRARGAPTPEN